MASNFKANDYFTAETKDGKLVLTMNLEAPCEANRSKGTITEVDGKEVKARDGKSYVIGRAFGKLPFIINGQQVKVNCYVTIPAESAKANVQEIILKPKTPPVIPPLTRGLSHEPVV